MGRSSLGTPAELFGDADEQDGGHDGDHEAQDVELENVTGAEQVGDGTDGGADQSKRAASSARSGSAWRA